MWPSEVPIDDGIQPVLASVHPGNDPLGRARVACIGWSERRLKGGLLNVDPIADRDEIGQNVACQGPPIRERQSETEVSEQRAGIRRMTNSRIEPAPYECVTFSNLDATREEDPQGVDGRPANSDAGEQKSQTRPLDRSIVSSDASYAQEAHQHADQLKAVRHIQGQQRSLVPIARRSCPMPGKGELSGPPDTQDRGSSASPKHVGARHADLCLSFRFLKECRRVRRGPRVTLYRTVGCARFQLVDDFPWLRNHRGVLQ